MNVAGCANGVDRDSRPPGAPAGGRAVEDARREDSGKVAQHCILSGKVSSEQNCSVTVVAVCSSSICPHSDSFS